MRSRASPPFAIPAANRHAAALRLSAELRAARRAIRYGVVPSSYATVNGDGMLRLSCPVGDTISDWNA